MKRFPGFISLLTAGFIYSTFSIYARLLNQNLLPGQQVFLRYLTGFVIISLFMIIRRLKFSLKGIPIPALLVYAFAFPINVVLFTLAVTQTKIALTGFSFYLGSILFSLIIGMLVFKEAFTKKKAVSILLALSGLLCFTLPFTESPVIIGIILSFCGGFFDALANASRKFLYKKANRFTLVNVQMIGAVIVAFVFALFTREPIAAAHITPLTIVILLAFAVSLIAISYLTLFGFSHFDLNLGTIVLSSELIFAIFFGWFFYQETLALKEIIGSICIAGAIIIPEIKNKSNKKKKK